MALYFIVRYILLSAANVQTKIFWGFWAQNIMKMKREVSRIHWYTAEKEKTNDTKVIKDQTYCIFYNLSDLSRNNTLISLGFQRQRP